MLRKLIVNVLSFIVFLLIMGAFLGGCLSRCAHTEPTPTRTPIKGKYFDPSEYSKY